MIEKKIRNLPFEIARGRILIGAGLVIVSLSQILFAALPDANSPEFKFSVAVCAAGILLFGAGVWLFSSIPAPEADSTPRIVPGYWVFAAIVLTLTATIAMILFEKNNRTSYTTVVTLWMGGCLCYLAAFLHTPPAFSAWKAWLRLHRMEWIAVALLTCLAAALRLYQLGTIPRVINGDEGWMGIVAQSTSILPFANPFSLWENFSGLYLQAMNLVIAIAGPSSFSLRLLPAISGILAVPCIYLLGRQVAGWRVGLLASALLAISHSHLHFSRISAVGYIHDTWLIPLELYLILSGLEKQSNWRAALAGILIGVQCNIYLTGQIVIGLILVFALLILLFFRKHFRNSWKFFIILAAAILITLMPQAVYAAAHPMEFFNRLNLDGTFQSGWLANETQLTGKSAAFILGDRVAHAFLSLIYYPAFDFYGSSLPLISLLTSSLFLLGLTYALWRTRDPNFLLLNGYFWSCTLAIGLFSIPASADSYRMLIILPAAMILAAVGLEKTLDSFGLGWNRWPKMHTAIIGFLLLCLLFINLWEYFENFAGQCRYGNDPQTRFASYLGHRLALTRREDTIFLLSDDIFWYGTHASASFLAPGRRVINVPEEIDSLSPVSGDILIASPNRTTELDDWAHAHPGGRVDFIYDCENLILVSYQIP